MPELTDIHCWLKLVDSSTGQPIPDGAYIEPTPSAKVTVRYYVANESDQPVGPFWVVGALYRNAERVKPAGQPNVVPAQQITLQPNQIWKKEHQVSESASFASYEARILGDVGSLVKEEDESNNRDTRTFTVYKPPA
jgi:hypothetical protein